MLAAYSAGSLDRLGHVLGDHGVAHRQPVADGPAAASLPPGVLGLGVLGLDQGFVTEGLAVIGEADILGDRLARPAKARRKSDKFLAELANFAAGDYVVHVEHGISRYDGLATLEVGGAPPDCLPVLYYGGGKPFVPGENIDGLSA